MAVTARRRGVKHVLRAVGGEWRADATSTQGLRATLRAGGLTSLAALRQLGRTAARSEADLSKGLVRLARAGERLLFSAAGRGASGLGPRDLRLAPLLSPDDFVPRRILMVNAALACGGAERQLVNTMVGLSGRGYDVGLICDAMGTTPGGTFFARDLADQGLAASPMRFSPGAFGGDVDAAMAARVRCRLAQLPSPFPDALWSYVMEILARRPQVVHAWQDRTSILAGAAALIAGVPRVVLSTRSLSPVHFDHILPYMRESYRTLLQAPNLRVINNSAQGRDDYAGWLEVGADAIGVVRNGVGPTAFRAPRSEELSAWRGAVGLPPDGPVVGSVFRLGPEKNPLLWVETAALVSERVPRARFLIVGTGPARRAMLARAQTAGISDRLVVPGALASPTVALAAMDLLLLTSRVEGLPNVPLEAQALGIPVVMTRAGGNEAAIRPGVTGWIVEDRSPAALADRICRVLADAAWSRAARELAPAFVRMQFDLDRMIDETVRVYGSGPTGRA